MSLRTTFYWIAGMLVGLGALLFAAKSFFPDAGNQDYAAYRSESGPPPPSDMGPPVIVRESEHVYSGPSDRVDPDLDSWYSEAGNTEDETSDFGPEGPGQRIEIPPELLVDTEGRVLSSPDDY
ncbi:hypothetical protein [Qipengyuania sp. 483]